MSSEYQKVCPPGLYPLGQHYSEGVLSVSRVVCTLVTVSIISSWYSRGGIGRLVLLFLHWIGGLVHLLSGVVAAQMVLNCWVGEELVPFIKALKFLELAGSNLVAVTNLAICANLAFIMHSHRTMSRVKSVSSSRMVVGCVAISVGFAAAALPFWNVWALTRASFQPISVTLDRTKWICTSYFIMEAVTGLVMSIIVVGLLLFRRSELREIYYVVSANGIRSGIHRLVRRKLRLGQPFYAHVEQLLTTPSHDELDEVWGLHGRIKFHVALTAIALIVNIAITAGGILMVVDISRYSLTVISWVLRYVHIALDTLVLYSALETPVFQLESDWPERVSISIHPQVVLRC